MFSPASPDDPALRCVPPDALRAPPADGAVHVCAPTPDSADLPAQPAGLGQSVLLRGVAALPHGALPIRHVLLPPSPTLDDLLAGALCAALCGPAPPTDLAEVDRLCDYAAQLREGLLPGSLPPERSLGGAYLAMVELYRDQPDVLTERGRRLLEHARQALRHGSSLLHDDVLAGADRFAREAAYLVADRQRYARDRDAGSVVQVRVGPLRGHLLRLSQPTSILFRLFAFRDTAAPGGGGFDLVLVQRRGPTGRLHVMLLADPTRRLPLREVFQSLCHQLNRREARRPAAAEEPWYDGARHGFQRLASPRAGTALPIADVQNVLYQGLHAGPTSPGARGPLALLLLALSCALLGPALRSAAPSIDSAQAPVVRGDWHAHRLPDGPPMPAAEREALLRAPPQPFAILMAASEYRARRDGGLGPLRTPWRDVCSLRHRLVSRFGYRPDHVVVLSDSPCLRGAGPPTRQQLLWTVEHLRISADDTLLFYYAGHGAIEDEPGGRYGYLQPAGWEQAGVSREDRGLRMRVLAELLRDKVAARHQLLLIDACHSGEAAIVRGDSGLVGLEAPARAGWRARPVYAVITAAGTDDLALEERLLDAPHPHSLFMRALLEGLSLAPRPGAPGCGLRADQDPYPAPDGLVTDGELFKYVARRVPELRAGLDVPGLPAEAQRQVPEWNPWAAAPRRGEGRLGEFLLVPRATGPAADPPACDPADSEPDECGACPAR